MEIPHTALAPTTLHNLLEEFVTREGTEYGSHDFTLDEKVHQVLRQLEQGIAVIVYDSKSETCHIETRANLNRNFGNPS